jgi:hypothetical protein
LEYFDAQPQENNENQSKALRIIRNIEREGRDLTPEEKKIILDHYLNRENLSAIDKHTADLLEEYEGKLEESETLTKAKRIAGKAATVVGTMASSFVGRTLLHKVGGIVGGFAGTITGFFVGGAVGGIKAYNAEKARQFGYNGITNEYNRIKNDQTNPRRVGDAISFLNNILETGEVFKGNRGDLLKLIIFYKGQLEGGLPEGQEQEFISRLGGELENPESPTNQNLELFRDDVKEACKKQAWQGAWRGALWGGGIGAVSDLVTWISHSIHFADHKNAYIKTHGINNEYKIQYNQNIGSAPDIAQDPHFTGLNSGTGLNLEANAYGNTLSQAVAEGLQRGDFEVPHKILEQFMAEGMTEQQAKELFIYNFNFAQPPSPESFWMHGQLVHFNRDGVTELVNQLAPDKILDPATGQYIDNLGGVDFGRYGEILSTSGRYLETNFPTDFATLQTTHNVIMERALSEATIESTRFGLQDAIQGAMLGAGIHIGTERSVKNLQKSAGGGGGSGETPDEDEEGEGAPQRPDRAPQQTPAEAAAGAPAEPAPREEERVEGERDDETITWEEEFIRNHEQFVRKANTTLRKLQGAWGELSRVDQQNIISLLGFVNEYNGRGLRFKYRIRQTIVPRPEGELKTITGVGSIEEPRLTLTNQEGREENIDLTTPIVLQLEALSRNPDDYDAPEERPIQFDDLLVDGRYDIEIIQSILDEARREDREVAITVQRQNGLFRGDDLARRVEIIGVDVPSRKLVMLTAGRIVEVDEDKFNKITTLNTLHWNQGGTDDQYSRRR